MKKLLYSIAFLALFSCDSDKFDSEVQLARLFSDGMVIQRDISISVWGKGIPGENVRVSLAGLVGSASVDADSTWIVELPKSEAGGPYILQVNEEKVNDVYIGDVWLAGGQSNMEWKLKSSVVGAEQEFEEGGNPEIRFFKVPNSYSAIPQTELKGGEWKVATKENLPDFSAVAWFFAKRNHAEKKVPVGIIESNWGGSPAEGWTDLEILAAQAHSYQEEAKDILANPEKWEKENLTNEKRREIRDLQAKSPDSLVANEVSSMEYNDSKWRKITLPAANPLQHIAWVRKKFSLKETGNVSLHLPDIEQMAFVYLNGKQVFYKDWGKPFDDIILPESNLLKGTNVLTLRVVNTWNNQPVIGSPGEMYLDQNGNKISLEGTWSYSNNIVEPELPIVEFYAFKPGMMYNAMIFPLAKYPIKGVIWYQGESNAGRHEEYKEVFSNMITNWRNIWQIGDFPFLFVQLANFMERKEVQPDSNWAFLREAQKNTLELPNTGMAVIIDIGEADDIHPRNKKDVGERLWLQAKNVAYGDKVLSSGPQFESFEREGTSLKIKFKSIGDGLQLKEGEELLGFIIGDSKGDFSKAKAELIDKSTVLVNLPENLANGEIRYAWADNPGVNLVNSIGLPAEPFRFNFE
ncbi:sialate O-acetylesterase [Algoriphagus marinus]|uniref:sialate O-acetylesterase n=1 Tax=Algoriphagus marinus TaxID=1925762 RepID=UPI00094B7E8F|nr:sialate O-acetylesterase [Algoriphagus marinus]